MLRCPCTVQDSLLRVWRIIFCWFLYITAYMTHWYIIDFLRDPHFLVAIFDVSILVENKSKSISLSTAWFPEIKFLQIAVKFSRYSSYLCPASLLISNFLRTYISYSSEMRGKVNDILLIKNILVHALNVKGNNMGFMNTSKLKTPIITSQILFRKLKLLCCIQYILLWHTVCIAV